MINKGLHYRSTMCNEVKLGEEFTLRYGWKENSYSTKFSKTKTLQDLIVTLTPDSPDRSESRCNHTIVSVSLSSKTTEKLHTPPMETVRFNNCQKGTESQYIR